MHQITLTVLEIKGGGGKEAAKKEESTWMFAMPGLDIKFADKSLLNKAAGCFFPCS
jgi:hypothetical protein